MGTLIAKSTLLLAINIAIALGYTTYLDTQRDYAPWETGSALYQIPKQEHCPYLFIGSSHMGVFRRCPDNVDAVHDATGTDVQFIAKLGSGIFQHHHFLREFYRRGNSADAIVCFIDPFAFYSAHWNETMRFIESEPLDLTFLLDLYRSGVAPDTLHRYVRSKYRGDWFNKKPSQFNRMMCDKQLEKRVPFEGRLVRHFYPQGTQHAKLAHYMRELRLFIETAQSHDTHLILIEPPTLLGTLPDIDHYRAALQESISQYDVDYYDLSESIPDIYLYRNHDHLNDAGVQHFLTNYLAPILTKTPGSR